MSGRETASHGATRPGRKEARRAMADTLRILVVSTPVGPIGSGEGGGVELTAAVLAEGLTARGHDVTVLAPAGSRAPGIRLVEVPGVPQVPAQTTGRESPATIPAGSVLAAMWDEVRRRQWGTDVVVNLAYDWLPMYLSGFLTVPVAHLVSMASLSDVMDEAVCSVVAMEPGSVAVHSRAQAETFPCAADLRVVGNGVPVERYPFVAAGNGDLAWVGRIAAEKGLDAAFAVAERTGRRLRVWGLRQDPGAWEAARAAHPGADVSYEGFLPPDALAAGLGQCDALLVTPDWVEAFGNVAVEALACGVPVVAYRRGGPAEIVEDGVTGFVVAPDDVDALVAAVARVGGLDRRACRADAEARWSAAPMAERVEAWLVDLLDGA
jgi:UDP-glucose:tetrahydrobiopterin glucosyltransferase